MTGIPRRCAYRRECRRCIVKSCWMLWIGQPWRRQVVEGGWWIREGSLAAPSRLAAPLLPFLSTYWDPPLHKTLLFTKFKLGLLLLRSSSSPEHLYHDFLLLSLVSGNSADFRYRVYQLKYTLWAPWSTGKQNCFYELVLQLVGYGI